MKPPVSARLMRGHSLAKIRSGWLFNERSGNQVFDFSGKIQGSLTGNTVWSDGFFGKCLEFDAVSGNVDFGTNPYPNFFYGGKSVSVWVYANTYGEGNNGIIIGPFNTGATKGWALYTRATNSGIAFYQFRITRAGQWTALMSLNALYLLTIVLMLQMTQSYTLMEFRLP